MKDHESKNFIKSAIRRPGALRGKAKDDNAIDKNGKIKVAWAIKKATEKPKTEQDKLTKQQASFFVNVLRKAGKTKK